MDFSLPEIACRVTTERRFGWVVEIARLGRSVILFTFGCRGVRLSIGLCLYGVREEPIYGRRDHPDSEH